ncbi:hypothetical protein PCK1_001892 [Pneumocystis canis]|nr:hypothetical protein PCK1_001892 [Pneumocystis canis]
MDTLIKESERLFTQLSVSPTLTALESYIQQLQYAQQLLKETRNGLHLSAEAILRPELMSSATQVIEAQREVQMMIQRYGKILDKQFRADLSAVHVHEQFPGHSKQLHSAIGMYLVRQAAFDMTQTFINIKSLNIPEFPNPIIPLLSPSIPNCLTPSSFSVYLKEMTKYQQMWYMYSSTYMNFFKKWADYTKNCYQSDLSKEMEVYEMFLSIAEKEEKIREGWWLEEKKYRQALRDFLSIKKQYDS